uniref:AlNc14C68G4781 protein n=1 Tax=Albugo laibachii Nc14 TaxID=890382 RepID=F0WDR2_9STRA|nr:AlNc14C68G4781 [Albugo laibachii Nc14]|eukprot:CCA19339.1 AlNc14C68G4781 [Albugo laibachii Nc14]
MGTNANGSSSTTTAVLILTGFVGVCAAAGYFYLSGLSTGPKKDRARECSNKKSDISTNELHLLEEETKSPTAGPIRNSRIEISELAVTQIQNESSIGENSPRRAEKYLEDGANAALLNTTAQEVAFEFVQESLLSLDALSNDTWRDYEQVELTKSMNDFSLVKHGGEDQNAEKDTEGDSQLVQESQVAENGTISEGFARQNYSDEITEPLQSAESEDDNASFDEENVAMPEIHDESEPKKSESPPASQESSLSQKAKKKRNKKKRS